MPEVTRDNCPRCRLHRWHERGGPLVCPWPWGTYDVNAAEELVNSLIVAGTARLITISWRTLRRYAERDAWLDPSNFEAAHLEHVDPDKPGILGTVGGDAGLRRFPVEGFHRAVRALRERRRYRTYLLTKEQTAGLLIQSDRGHSARAPRAVKAPRHAPGRGQNQSP